MSERMIAERHEFTTARGNEAAVAFDPQCPDHPDLFGPCTEVDLRLEILRLRGDRDALGKALADTAAFWEDRANGMLHPDHEQLCREAAVSIRRILPGVAVSIAPKKKIYAPIGQTWHCPDCPFVTTHRFDAISHAMDAKHGDPAFRQEGES